MSRWPHPLDTPVEIAQKVAHMYRARLRALSVTACDEADDVAVSFGQEWVRPRLAVNAPDKDLTTSEAAEFIGRSQDTIRQWACMDHPENPGQKLLPRYGQRGRERTYLAEHVLAAAAAVTRTRRRRDAA